MLQVTLPIYNRATEILSYIMSVHTLQEKVLLNKIQTGPTKARWRDVKTLIVQDICIT